MSMIDTRSADLLREAAVAFQDGRDPFSGDWLFTHAVTSDECMWLSNYIGVLLLGFLQTTERTQKKILIAGVSGGEIGAAVIDALVDNQADMQRLKDLPKNIREARL